ncbi:MAG: rhodanese-like domain-containing protein [Thermodesulfobacteriota bacterium]
MFRAGLPAWKKAGHLVVSNIDALDRYNKEDLSYILIDLRPKEEVEKGHIPKAVGMPEGGITVLKDQFPKYKGAQVILYNEDGQLASAEKPFKEIAGWGYNNVSVLSGGLSEWKKAGKQVAQGPAATKISYVRKLLPGEFEVDAFKALVANPKEEIIVLDVRTPQEIEEGILPKARAIPLDTLETKLSELPKDRTIVIHCSTGLRAEMAYNVLKKAGYNAKYVKAKVDFDKEKKGSYTIEE